MGTGRNSFLITLRLPNELRDELDTRALKRGESIGKYLAGCIIRSVHTTPATSGDLANNTETGKNRSVHTITPTSEGQQKGGTQVENRSVHTIDDSPPWYNPEIHTTGDTVRMRDPRTKEVKVVTL